MILARARLHPLNPPRSTIVKNAVPILLALAVGGLLFLQLRSGGR
jgi:hypothetical protein